MDDARDDVPRPDGWRRHAPSHDDAGSKLIVYVPYARVASRTMGVMLRTATDPEAAVATVRRVIRERFSGLPVYDLRTMAQVRRYTTWEQRIFGQVIAG